MTELEIVLFEEKKTSLDTEALLQLVMLQLELPTPPKVVYPYFLNHEVIFKLLMHYHNSKLCHSNSSEEECLAREDSRKIFSELNLNATDSEAEQKDDHYYYSTRFLGSSGHYPDKEIISDNAIYCIYSGIPTLITKEDKDSAEKDLSGEASFLTRQEIRIASAMICSRNPHSASIDFSSIGNTEVSARLVESIPENLRELFLIELAGIFSRDNKLHHNVYYNARREDPSLFSFFNYFDDMRGLKVFIDNFDTEDNLTLRIATHIAKAALLSGNPLLFEEYLTKILSVFFLSAFFYKMNHPIYSAMTTILAIFLLYILSISYSKKQILESSKIYTVEKVSLPSFWERKKDDIFVGGSLGTVLPQARYSR
ncbi:MAG: hypothetical protein WCI57_05295 [Candidatus Berkelbacteria bacterium]